MTQQQSAQAYDHRIRQLGHGYVIEWTANVPDEMDRVKPMKFKKRVGFRAAKEFAGKHRLEFMEQSFSPGQ